MAKKKPTLEIGQTIYVETVGFLSGNEPKEPKPYAVIKINTTSILVESLENGMGMRFEKKTWTSKSLLGDTNYIWVSSEEYWKVIKEKEDAKKMRALITLELEKMSLEELQEIAGVLKAKNKQIKNL